MGEEVEDGIRRETERERRQRRRQISKDTLKQLCAYSGLRSDVINHYQLKISVVLRFTCML